MISSVLLLRTFFAERLKVVRIVPAAFRARSNMVDGVCPPIAMSDAAALFFKMLALDALPSAAVVKA